jgi:hypothetical protein
LILGYHGSLYGDWFDWDAMGRVAGAYPDAAVVLIGDDKVRPVELPGNVHFLGLKAQRDLPAYVQRFDVGLLPFKVNATTHAVSPLKVYEYLASGVPVAAPPLRSLDGLEGVYNGTHLIEGTKLALLSHGVDRTKVLAECSWATRVAAIIGPARVGNDTRGLDAATVIRTPRHHRLRLLGYDM